MQSQARACGVRVTRKEPRKRLLGLAVALLAVAVVTVGHGNATAAAVDPRLGDRIDLEAAASSFAGRPIQITVNTELPGSWAGGAWVGLPFVSLGRDAYNDAERGGGLGLSMLLHELGHVFGIKNEGDANCFALAHLIRFIRANWQTEYLDAWAYRVDPVMTRYRAAVAGMLQQSAVYQCVR